MHQLLRGTCRPTTFVGAFLLLATGCVRAPEVAVLTERTALERQAGGEYPARDEELANAAISPGPDPIPRERLLASGDAASLRGVDELVAHAVADDERVEALLLAQCIGEASDGLVAPLEHDCDDVDENDLVRLIGRVNVHRRQVWGYLAEQAPPTTVDEARDRWRVLHLKRVVCGASVQDSAGRWERKPCAE